MQFSNQKLLDELKEENPNWEDYTKYAEAFYPNLYSKKLLVEACVYFKQKVAEIGFAPDGADRVLEMIRIVKSNGAYHHTAFDKQFSVEAYNKVLREEKKRLARQQKASDMDEEEDKDADEPAHYYTFSAEDEKKAKISNQIKFEMDKIIDQTQPQSAKKFVTNVLRYKRDVAQVHPTLLL